MSSFGPKNDEEREEFAAEKFRVDVQHRLQTVMNRKKVNQKELAKRLKVSEARVSQIFSSSCNVTLRMLARAFFALGDECWLDSRELQAARRAQKGVSCWATTDDTTPSRQADIDVQPFEEAQVA